MAQRTILQIAQAVNAELGFPKPTTVVSSTDTNVIKLLALITATCEDLMNEFDWQALQKRYTFNTQNGVEEYALPTDTERFISSSFFDQNNRWPMQGPLNATEWEALRVSGLNASPFQRYRVFGNMLHLFPTPGASPYTFVYEYVSNSFCTSSGGVAQTTVQQDSDIILLDSRCVIYGSKLKWLSSNNMDTTSALVDYMRALDFAKSSDVPARRLSLAGGSMGTPLLSTANLPDTDFGGV